MRNRFLPLFKVLIYASIIAGISACSKTQHNQTAQGGQDSGGGDPSVSTIEEVEFYYNRVFNLSNVVLVKLFSDQTISNFKNIEKRNLLIQARHKIAKVLNLKPEEAIGYDDFAHFIKLYPITIKKDSSCSSIDKSHVAGSIKEFSSGNPICISFKELTKIPRSSLEKEIIGLLLHELMHGIGYDETHARTIQLALVNNFDKLIPHGLKMFLKTNENTLTIEGLVEETLEKELDDAVIEFIIGFYADPPKPGVMIDKDQWKVFCASFFLDNTLEAKKNENFYLLSRLGSQMIDSNEVTEEEFDHHYWVMEELTKGTSNLNAEFTELCEKQKNRTLSEEMRSLMKLMSQNLSRFYKAIDKYEALFSVYE